MVVGADDASCADVHAEEAVEGQQQGRHGDSLLPVLPLLVPGEMLQVHQQERLYTGEEVTFAIPRECVPGGNNVVIARTRLR